MPPSDLIDRTANHVQTILSGDGTGHDWWHIHGCSSSIIMNGSRDQS